MNTILLSVLVLGLMGAVLGALLAVASKVFHVEVDPKQEAVRQCLAGANCGGCGYPGCDGYAAAVAAGKAPTNKCVAGGAETAAKVAEIMGVSAGADERRIAFVPCSGCEGHAEMRFNYTGTRACKFDAIHIVEGIAQVDRSKCVGCGACAEACPKSIIKLLPASQRVMPACSNKDKGAKVMKMCDYGCIGCMKCQRECPADAIKVVDNLAVVDSEKCVGCGHCADVCPRQVIRWFEKA